jgi:hypothetical protein
LTPGGRGFGIAVVAKLIPKKPMPKDQQVQPPIDTAGNRMLTIKRA